MYKELAAELRLFETVCKHSDKPDLADLVGRAANAIEELQKKYDGAVSDNKSLCGQIAELAKERNEAYSKGLLEGGIAQRAEDEKWMPQWIPVTERLPKGADTSGEICENVNLLFDDGLVTCGWMNGITGKVYYLNVRDDYIQKTPISRVTHWMPLPEPPKEETC